jgi:hypothetical protein
VLVDTEKYGQTPRVLNLNLVTLSIPESYGRADRGIPERHRGGGRRIETAAEKYYRRSLIPRLAGTTILLPHVLHGQVD